MVRASMSRAIDVKHLGRERVICAYEVDGLVVDPGPASCLDTLLDGLEGEPRALLLTHIHLDHAGAAGVLRAALPALQVYVHERGAPHLVDPSKLLKSAARLYGDDMERAVGRGGAGRSASASSAWRAARRSRAVRVAYTPGHASHHVCYLDERHRRRLRGRHGRRAAARPTSTRWRRRRRRTSTWTRGWTRST